MNSNDMFPKHEPGNGRLRALLQRLDEDQEKLFNNPLYVEGYDDGYAIGKTEATEEAKCVVRGLMRMWDDEE